MEKVRRKSLLYKSGLGFWCLNHVQGCGHGCRYPCYASLMARRYGRAKDEGDWRRPRLVEGAVELLERELSRRRDRLDVVHLCLTTDPFMVGYPEVAATSLALIGRLNAHGVRASVLTKGILPLELYFGGWNYSPLAGAYAARGAFYRGQARIVRAFCREHHIRGAVDA